jgi:N-acetylglutamate synthase-like GNAT family acetyltransferase
VPRSAARVEDHGPLRLFLADGVPWPYYARPARGEVSADDVAAMRARQRELGVPEAFEWVDEITPSLLPAARAGGLNVLEAPLMVLDQWRPAEPPAGIRLRHIEPDDPGLAAARAVADVGFRAAGTRPGPEGARERDAAAAAQPEAALAQVRARLRDGLTVMVVVERDGRPLSVGSHNPLGDVTEIVGVATLPAVRRQGLAGVVTSGLVWDARNRGVETIFLSAGSEDIARVYARLGFRRVGTACIAEPA